ncbi:MAG: 5-demethoxyubiquinol-8 5-hydroxylase UbiM [Sphingopyxis sp.]
MAHDADIIIIGAGPAGLCFAKAMAKSGRSIIIVEKLGRAALADPPYDGREIALTHLSKQIMAENGIWPLIPPERTSCIQTAKVMNGRSPFALSFDHPQVGGGPLGFMIANNEIRKAAFAAIADAANIRLMDRCEVKNIGADSGCGWVELADGDRLSAGLIVAADSRFSATRRMMGIPCAMLDFGRTCIVCTMGCEKPHLSAAYECFHADQTLAVLPLGAHQVSVVVTVESENAARILAMSAQDFATDMAQRFGHRLGAMNLTSELFSYPLVATFAKRFHAHRFAVIGDAAVGMHPVTAHGFNLGLRGALCLAQELLSALARGGDIGASAPLARYSAKHSRICAPLYHGTNALVRLYTGRTMAARLSRHALLRVASHLAPARRMITNQLTSTGPLPLT